MRDQPGMGLMLTPCVVAEMTMTLSLEKMPSMKPVIRPACADADSLI